MNLKALSNIEHNRERYVAGDVFEVESEQQAQALIDAGAAEETATKKEKGLSKMNKAELQAVAQEEGVEVTEDMTNDQMIEAIKAKRES